jgi:serine protease Do
MSHVPSQRSLRGALLGAVALAALGGVAVEGAFAPIRAVAAATLPSAGPASFADIVERVKPSVVSVKVQIADAVDSEDDSQGMPDLSPDSPFYKFFRHFGMPDDNQGQGQGQGMLPHRQRHLTQAQGSGFFISGDGYIVTNNHVVDHAKTVTVTTTDGKTLDAKVIGTDAKTDLALLKVNEGSDHPFVTFADHAPRVGDWVIAVGNPFGLGGTVTAGIVSARGRDIGSGPYDDFLQIDAPVNHGNSGGPTFDTEGQVVGVNTAIFSPSGGSVGIGFAIASDVVKAVVEQLKDNGAVTRGWLGVEIQPVTQDIADSLGLKNASGALVANPQANSPAGAAGVKSGDVVTAVNGEAVEDPRELARRIAGIAPKKTVTLSIIREGSPMTIDVTLGVMPKEQIASAETPPQHEEPAPLAKYGLTLKAATGKGGGVAVVDVDPAGVAADKGLQAGDIILEVAGKPVAKPADVTEAFDAAKSGGKKSVLIRVKSGDNERFLALPANAG